MPVKVVMGYDVHVPYTKKANQEKTETPAKDKTITDHAD